TRFAVPGAVRCGRSTCTCRGRTPKLATNCRAAAAKTSPAYCESTDYSELLTKSELRINYELRSSSSWFTSGKRSILVAGNGNAERKPVLLSCAQWRTWSRLRMTIGKMTRCGECALYGSPGKLRLVVGAMRNGSPLTK